MNRWMKAVVKAVEERMPPVFCVHYACDSFVGARQSSAGVTAIAVRVVGLNQTKVFSLAMMAEREGVPVNAILLKRETLEKKLLEEFHCYVERMNGKYPDAYWCHWAMRDATFGWPMLEHRLRALLQISLCLREEQLIDIHASLAGHYGREFIARPQLLQLAELNGMAHGDLLTGPVEAEALLRGDYVAISRSTAKKAEIIGQVVVSWVEGRLLTGCSRVKKRSKRWTAVRADSLPRELIGVDEAARLCGVSRATWYRLLNGAKIPLPHKIGGRRLWDAKELRLWIDSSCPGQKRWRLERRLFGLGEKS